MSEKSEASREFQPIEDFELVRRYLQEGSKSLSSTLFWIKDHEKVIETHLTVYSATDQGFYVWKPPAFDPDQFKKDLVRLQTGDQVYFSVSHPSVNIFFRTRYLTVDSGGIKFATPLKIFKVQRRKDVRLTISDPHTLKLTFNDPLFPEKEVEKKIIDISASGLAFQADPGEELVYDVGLMLKDISLKVNGREIKSDGEIRYVGTFSAARMKRLKIGIEFKGIRPGDSQLIASYIFEQTRQYFAKFFS